MFKDEFKEANDSIHASRELTDRVLGLRSRQKIKLNYYIPAAAAAVVVLSTSIAVLPRMLNKDKDDVIYQVHEAYDEGARQGARVADAGVPEAPPENTDGAHPDAAADKASAETNSKNAASAPIEKSAASPARAKSASEILDEAAAAPNPIEKYVPYNPSEKSAAARNDGSATDATERNAAENTAEEPAEEYSFSGEAPSASASRTAPENIDSQTKNVVLNMNSASSASGMYAAKAYLGGELYSGDISYEEWTFGDYFDYIGTDFLWSIPDGLTLVGHTDEIRGESLSMGVDEYGSPVFDNAVFAYEGDSGRWLSIQTTRSLNTVMTYLTDENLIKSKAGDIEAVLIGDAESWRCFCAANGTAYIISGDNISEEELGELLLSL